MTERRRPPRSGAALGRLATLAALTAAACNVFPDRLDDAPDGAAAQDGRAPSDGSAGAEGAAGKDGGAGAGGTSGAGGAGGRDSGDASSDAPPDATADAVTGDGEAGTEDASVDASEAGHDGAADAGLDASGDAALDGGSDATLDGPPPGPLAVLSASKAATTSGDRSSLAFPHDVAMPGLALVVGVVLLPYSAAEVSTVVRGTDVLVRLGGVSTGSERVEIWANPSVAAGTASVVVSTTSGTRIAAGAVTISGVSASAPFGSFEASSGSGPAPALTQAAAAAGELSVVVLGVSNGAVVATPTGASQLRWHVASTGQGANLNVLSAGATGLVPTADGPVTASFTLSFGAAWTVAAVTVRPP